MLLLSKYIGRTGSGLNCSVGLDITILSYFLYQCIRLILLITTVYVSDIECQNWVTWLLHIKVCFHKKQQRVVFKFHVQTWCLRRGKSWVSWCDVCCRAISPGSTSAPDPGEVSHSDPTRAVPWYSQGAWRVAVTTRFDQTPRKRTL